MSFCHSTVPNTTAPKAMEVGHIIDSQFSTFWAKVKIVANRTGPTNGPDDGPEFTVEEYAEIFDLLMESEEDIKAGNFTRWE